jgi:hypothetical protein
MAVSQAAAQSAKSAMRSRPSRAGCQRVHDQIEEGAEDAWTHELKLPPQFSLRLSPYLGNSQS